MSERRPPLWQVGEKWRHDRWKGEMRLFEVRFVKWSPGDGEWRYLVQPNRGPEGTAFCLESEMPARGPAEGTEPTETETQQRESVDTPQVIADAIVDALVAAGIVDRPFDLARELEGKEPLGKIEDLAIPDLTDEEADGFLAAIDSPAMIPAPRWTYGDTVHVTNPDTGVPGVVTFRDPVWARLCVGDDEWRYRIDLDGKRMQRREGVIVGWMQ